MFSNSRLLDSINKPEELIDYAFKLGLKGIAITDHSILSAHMLIEEHIEKRKKENPDNIDWQNFKLIRGDEIYLVRNGLTQDNFISKQDYFYHFVLLALDAEGHKQLRELSGRAYQRSWFKNMVRVPTYYSDIEEVIGKNPGHVYGLTACLGGFVPKHILSEDFSRVNQFIEWGKGVFNGLFALELQPSKEKEQILVNKTLIQLAKEFDIEYVITTDSHYLNKEERHLHKAFLNAKHGEREVDSFYATTYVMDAEEIHNYMDSQIGFAAVERGLNTTNTIAKLVTNYSLKHPLKIPYMPKEIYDINIFPTVVINELFSSIPLLKTFAEGDDADNQLAYYIIEYFVKNPKEINTKSMDRIQEELIAIKTTSDKMQVQWSKYLLQMKHHVDLVWQYADTLIGAGRGSAVSFYINYILGITQVDPMKEKTALKSWRFLNPERASVLDKRTFFAK